MTSTRTPIAIWLMPDAATARTVQPILERLAVQWQAPRFDAHVTLHVGDHGGAHDPDEALRAVASRSAPIVLRARACAHSDVYFRTLYLPLASAEGGAGDAGDAGDATDLPCTHAIHAFRAALVESLAERDPDHPGVARAVASYPLEPHLSLLYARIDASGRAALCERAWLRSLAGSTLRFDRIALVRPAPGRPDLSEVSHWQALEGRPLEG